MTTERRTRTREAGVVYDAGVRLRALAEAATATSWATARAAAHVMQDLDAKFIAAMSPEVAIATVEFLESVTVWDDEHSTGLNWEQPVPAKALSIAKAILGRTR